MALWLPIAALSALSVWVLVWPLIRERHAGSEDRAAYDLRIAEDQLAEIGRDLDQGVIDAEQAETARHEIKRRMLVALESLGPAKSPRPSGQIPVGG